MSHFLCPDWKFQFEQQCSANFQNYVFINPAESGTNKWDLLWYFGTVGFDQHIQMDWIWGAVCGPKTLELAHLLVLRRTTTLLSSPQRGTCYLHLMSYCCGEQVRAIFGCGTCTNHCGSHWRGGCVCVEVVLQYCCPGDHSLLWQPPGSQIVMLFGWHEHLKLSRDHQGQKSLPCA